MARVTCSAPFIRIPVQHHQLNTPYPTSGDMCHQELPPPPSRQIEGYRSASAEPQPVRQPPLAQRPHSRATRRTVSATEPHHTDASEHPLQALFHLVKQRQQIRLELLISLIGFIRWGPHPSTS